MNGTRLFGQRVPRRYNSDSSPFFVRMIAGRPSFMPIYEYMCTNTACGPELEALQKISDERLVYCPSCGEATLKKKISAAGFRLKGTGWYETDFKNSGKKAAAKDSSKDAGGEAKSGAESKSGGEAKSGGESSAGGGDGGKSPSGSGGDSAKSGSKSSGGSSEAA